MADSMEMAVGAELEDAARTRLGGEADLGGNEERHDRLHGEGQKAEPCGNALQPPPAHSKAPRCGTALSLKSNGASGGGQGRSLAVSALPCYGRRLRRGRG